MTRRNTKESSKTTPPTIRTMGVREFTRGAIYDLTETTMVMSHNTELGMWVPRGQSYDNVYLATTMTNAAAAQPSSTTSFNVGTPSVLAGARVDIAGLNASIQKMQEYVSRLPKTDDEEKENG